MKRITLFLIMLITVVGSVSHSAYAGTNFVVIRLPNGVSVEIPRNWQVTTNDERITLDTTVESQLDLSNLPRAASDLVFVAGYFDDVGDKAKISVRYYPNMKVTQSTVRQASPEEIRELFDNAQKQIIYEAFKASGDTILHWGGTRKQVFAERIAIVTEYRRAPISGEQGSFNVRIIRILDGSRTFTLTVSYNESYAVIFNLKKARK
jgi:hypothetical protein